MKKTEIEACILSHAEHVFFFFFVTLNKYFSSYSCLSSKTAEQTKSYFHAKKRLLQLASMPTQELQLNSLTLRGQRSLVKETRILSGTETFSFDFVFRRLLLLAFTCLEHPFLFLSPSFLLLCPFEYSLRSS